MRFRKNLKGRVLGSVVVAVIVAGSASAAALATTSRAEHSSTQTARQATVRSRAYHAVRARAASAFVAAHYGVFRRAATPADALTGAPSSVITRLAGPRSAARAAAATAAGAASVYLLDEPGSRLCIVAHVPQLHVGIEGCGTESASATQPTLAIIRNLHGPDFVAGPAPDGVTSVTIDQNDGTSVTVPVQNNVYLASVSGGYHAQRLHFADGHASAVR